MFRHRALMRVVSAALLVAATLAVGPATPATADVAQPVISQVEVQPDASTLRIAWPRVAAATSYEVYFRPVGTSAWQWSGASTVGADHGSYVPVVDDRATYTRDFKATGIVRGRAYEVAVRAVAGSELSTLDDRAVRVTAAPPISSATATARADGTLTLAWPRYTAGPATQLDFYVGADGTTPSWAGWTPDTDSTSRTFSGLVPGKRYTAGVRVTQQVVSAGGSTTLHVRTALTAARAVVPGSQELFRSSAEHPFVSTDTGRPFTVNGVNLKRVVHRESPGGPWVTPYVVEEVESLGEAGAPDFDTVRMTMDWPYFQKQVGSSVVLDQEAFEQLDLVIDAAREQGLYVILDPIHVSNPGPTMCREDPVMRGAHRDVPAWAWRAVGLDPGTGCGKGAVWDDAMDDVLGLQQTADYLRAVARRYDGSTARGRQVIAIDLVNEPAANGRSSADKMRRLVAAAYKPWLAASGSRSVRAVDPDKPLIVEPPFGSGSLAGVSLDDVARPNVIMSLHDYFGRALDTDPVHGVGFSSLGFPSQKEDTDRTENALLGSYVPYLSSAASYEQRRAERKSFLTQAKRWTDAADMPLFVGEYGILNPCGGGSLAASTQYAKDSYALYEELGLSRTVWAHGFWDGMALWWRGDSPDEGCGATDHKAYFPYASDYTGGAVR